MSVLITNDRLTENKFTIITNNTGGNNVGLFATTPSNGPLINFLIVGGGGGGGIYSGGGAGGVVVGSFSNFLRKDTLFITVGAGGAVYTNGSNSSIKVGSSYAPIVAYGGGSGGYPADATATKGLAGGSGGGVCGFLSVFPFDRTITTGGSAVPGLGGTSYGNSGGGNMLVGGSYVSHNIAGGGGGGAGTPGFKGFAGDINPPKNGNGGRGIINPITSSTVGQLSAGNYWVAGGGGGGIITNYGPVTPGPGGPGGGGSSGISDAVPTPATAGAVNTGGGGGGSADTDYDVGVPTGLAAAGGSGVVVIAYNNPTQLANGGTVTNPSSNYWIHTFTSSETLTFI